MREHADVSPLEVRPLTEQERALARWMLEHGSTRSAAFLPQLDRAEATNWRCPCGCPSIHFRVAGLPPAPPGVAMLADFMFGPADEPYGVFLYEQGDILSALEVFGYAGNHPQVLPDIADLRPVARQGVP